ncbi:hypothetical protein PUN4_800041 [Paraburkholderia unamae]|nr:hypothetical protein PUN4_800041 [Paraburkholderia unamae]
MRKIRRQGTLRGNSIYGAGEAPFEATFETPSGSVTPHGAKLQAVIVVAAATRRSKTLLTGGAGERHRQRPFHSRKESK